MKKVFLIAITSLFMAACSKSDDKGIDRNSFAGTTWELVHSEGYYYETLRDSREDWNYYTSD